MHKRYLPIAIAAPVLFLIALGGYLFPATPDAMPVRVLLDNKGGKVLLNHAAHADLADQDCGRCHHTTSNDPNPPACSDCHAAKFDAPFRTEHQKIIPDAQCSTCHHPAATIAPFKHDEHAEDFTDGDCQSCHHDTSIEASPQACANCHLDGTNSVLSLRDAAHERCADCHADMFQDGVKGCRNCHERRPLTVKDTNKLACSSCHLSPADQLVPTAMNAFHAKCMGCHQEQGAGPFGDASCNQCHMK